MKRKAAALLICVMTVFVLFAGCGKETKQDETTKNNSVENSKFLNVGEYVKEPSVKDELAGVMQESSSDEGSLSISGEENNLIYTVKYNEKQCKSDDDRKILKAYFESFYEEQSDKLVQLAANLAKEVEQENPAIIIRILDDDDTLIFERTFLAK